MKESKNQKVRKSEKNDEKLTIESKLTNKQKKLK